VKPAEKPKPKKKKMTISQAFDTAYDVCIEDQAKHGDVMVAALQAAMVTHVKATYPRVIRAERERMLAHEAVASVERRTSNSRPSAKQIQRMKERANGVQPPLFPTLAEALEERYPMPDGRLVPLGEMTADDLLKAILVRRKGIDEDRVILERLESMHAAMVKQNLTTVRALLA
jgi:hypothetical protein